MVQDPNGDLFDGVMVTLYAADGCPDQSLVADATTGSNGAFSFSVTPGDYDLYLDSSYSGDAQFPGFEVCTASAPETTDAAGIAVVPFLTPQSSINLGVTPPAGSPLSATSVATGPLQADTSVTAVLPGSVQQATTTVQPR